MSSEPSTPKSGKGFSGLDSLISDVSKDVQVGAEKVPRRTPATDTAPQPESKPLPGRSEATPHAGSYIGNGKFLVWISVGVVGFLLVVGALENSTKLPTPSAQSATAPAPTAPLSPASPTLRPTPAEPRLEYERPPVGTDHAHNAAQLRYCIREKNRLDGLEGVVNTKSSNEIDRFNALVDDYNSRCAKFRYKTSDMARVQRELEPLRSSFVSSAISEWRR